MTLELVVDSAGRIQLPESVRDALHLKEGDRLQVETYSDSIVMQPIRHTGNLASVLRAVDEDRDERAETLIYAKGA